ncbi:MAG TPA: VOC family protein [Actinomycetota bacterium]|nr:VOC family protein [Actinomycetota bacterium]
MRLTDVRLLVDDVAAVARFYRDVLGLEQRLDADVYVEFTGERATLGIYRRDLMASVVGGSLDPIPATAPDRALLAIEVDDVDASYREVTGRGGSFVTEPQDQKTWGLRVAHLRDPAGNLIELYQRIPID